MNEHELYHHGIKGMKWGVRRYQNKDGTLTAAGRRRFGSKENYDRYEKSSNEYRSAKAAKKAAGKKYDKSFNEAYKSSEKVWRRIPFTKSRARAVEERDKNIDKAWDDAQKYAKSTLKYREAKKDFRQTKRELRKDYKEREKAATKKFDNYRKRYHPVERRLIDGKKRAVQLMMEKPNRKLSSVNSQVRSEAIRNTAIFLAGIGGYTFLNSRRYR